MSNPDKAWPSKVRQRFTTCTTAIVTVVLMLVGLIFFEGLSLGATAKHNASRLRIVSPTQGAVINKDFVEVRYQMSKSIQGTHIHCYVDGEPQRGFKGVVTGLTSGVHEIKLVATKDDRNGPVAEASVTIEVE